jgi:hypothetical protein
MSSKYVLLWVKVEKQFQLCLKFLGFSVIMLKNHDMAMTIEHVKNDSPSLKVNLQK